MPTDAESYVHRIGRTGRAGREGDAILFVAPRERGLLKMIERTTRKHIEIMAVPSDAATSALVYDSSAPIASWPLAS